MSYIGFQQDDPPSRAVCIKMTIQTSTENPCCSSQYAQVSDLMQLPLVTSKLIRQGARPGVSRIKQILYCDQNREPVFSVINNLQAIKTGEHKTKLMGAQ